MSPAARLDFANIGLMVFSFAVAMYLPFELFLFSYAVLGPAHYLTEIAWLHQRKYFTHGPRDYMALVLLAALAALIFLTLTTESLSAWRPKSDIPFNTLMYVAFAGALLMAVVKNAFYRFIGVALLLVCATFSKSYLLFFSFFLPTLVHVYLFTGCFILYGALRSRSWPALLSLGVFVACPVVFFLLKPAGSAASSYAAASYQMFEGVNLTLIDRLHLDLGSTPDPHQRIYASTAGLVVMRFVAFAYTYHYLNWFSKTSIIQWHQMPRPRLAVIAGIWLASLALYWYDYATGLKWLFFLSLGHVFLEFPLNHLTFINIGKELKKRVWPGQAVA